MPAQVPAWLQSSMATVAPGWDPNAAPPPMPSTPMVQPGASAQVPAWLQAQAQPGYNPMAPAPAMPPPILPPGTALAQEQAAAQTIPEAPPVAPQDNGALPSLITQAARGSYGYTPSGVSKVGEQWSNVSPGAMPGDVPRELPNRWLPGVDDPTADEIMRAKLLPSETSGDLYARLATDKAQLRAHPVQPSQYDQAKTALEETQNEALLNRRLAMSEAANVSDQDAIMATIAGRAQAAEAQRIQADQEKARATIDARVGELDQLISEHSTASAGNPVKNYWSNMGTFGHIASALALGLGAAGQSLNGGQNVALELINKGINGEIAKQQALVDSLGAKISAKRSLLGDLMGKFLSPQAALLATRAALTGQAESELRRQAANEKSAVIRDRMNAEADTVAAERDKMKTAALEAEHKTLSAWHPARSSGKSGLDSLVELMNKLGVQPKDRLAVMSTYGAQGPEAAAAKLREIGGGSNGADITEGEARGMRMQRGTLVTLPNGDKANALTPEEGEKYRTSLSLLRVFNNNISEMEQMVNSANFVKGVRNGTVVAKLKTLALQNNAIQKNFLEQGMQDKAEYERTMPLTGEFISNMENVVDPSFDPRAYLGDLRRITNKGLLDKITPNLTTDWKSQKPFKTQAVTRPVK